MIPVPLPSNSTLPDNYCHGVLKILTIFKEIISLKMPRIVAKLSVLGTQKKMTLKLYSTIDYPKNAILETLYAFYIPIEAVILQILS